MPIINSVTIEGYLIDDPRMIGDANPMASFTVSVPGAGYDTNDKEADKSMFLRCTAFRKTAEAILTKGAKRSHVFMTGNLQQEFFVRKDDSKGSEIRLIVNNVRFVNDVAAATEDTNPVEVLSPTVETEDAFR